MSYNVPAHSSSVPAYQLIVDVTEKNGGNTIEITLCSTYVYCPVVCQLGCSLVTERVGIRRLETLVWLLFRRFFHPGFESITLQWTRYEKFVISDQLRCLCFLSPNY